MKVEISVGELADKVSILEIKLRKIKKRQKLLNIQYEYDLLLKELSSIPINLDNPDYQELVRINECLWDIEDKIRIKESKSEFDAEFIQLARKVYFTNDLRADVKRKINKDYNSKLVEEKEYVQYQKKSDSA